MTEFRKAVQGRCPVRAPLPRPVSLPPLPGGLDPGRIPGTASEAVAASGCSAHFDALGKGGTLDKPEGVWGGERLMLPHGPVCTQKARGDPVNLRDAPEAAHRELTSLPLGLPARGQGSSKSSLCLVLR